MSFISRLFGIVFPAPGPAPEPELSDAPPPWAAELLESFQKAARTQAKLGLRVEAVESKVEGGFSSLRAALASAAQSAAAPSSLPWDDLLDALDVLDEACRSLEARQEGDAAAGLHGVLARLERFLSRGGLSRISTAPVADGRLFRVVGEEHQAQLPDGAVARVVRAAVVSGERVVREGEVLINRSSP